MKIIALYASKILRSRKARKSRGKKLQIKGDYRDKKSKNI